MLESTGIPEEPLALDSSFPADGEDEIAVTVSPVLVFNHQMAAGATSAVTLKNASGATVAGSKTLDVTGKILTINPTANLSSASEYTITIANAPDIYGATIEDEIGFTTA
jgi:hypothetical protein